MRLMKNSTLIALFLSVGLLTLATSVSALSPIYIDATYTKESAQPRTLGVDAFRTIQEGINAVDKDGVVYVKKGNYAEALIIEKSMSLIGNGSPTATGASSNAPTIDGGNASGTIIINGTTEPITVTIHNFDINYGVYGVAVLQNATVTADRLTVHGYRKNGITFGPVFFPGEGGIRGVISNNIVTGMGPTDVITQNGIQVAEGNTAIVTGNTVSNHVYTMPGKKWATGILIHHAKGVTASNNTLSSNQAGINILQSTGTTLLKNTILGNTSSKAGIMVTNADSKAYTTTDNTINRNTVKGGFIGIWASYGSGNKYTNNTISDATKSGIYTWDSDNNTITGNVISSIRSSSHDGYGIMLDGGDTTTGTIGSDYNYVANNSVTSSDAGSFIAKNSHNNTFFHNRF